MHSIVTTVGRGSYSFLCEKFDSMPPRKPLSRSEQMSRIRGKNTGPERRLRSALWAAGLRYRLYTPTTVGRPDVVFPSRKLAVFVDGCFWHGCPRHYVRPGSREEHWTARLRINVSRDRRQTLELEVLGWRVIRVWEHEVYEDLDLVVQRISLAVQGEIQDEVSLDWRVVAVEELDPATRWERRHLEQLRDSTSTRTEDGRRMTTKWRRPPSS